MKLITHFLSSFFISIIFFPFFGLKSILIFVGGFLIDIDHIFYYIVRFKNYNIKKIYDYYKKIGENIDSREYKKILRIFHSFELFIIFVALSFFLDYFFFLTIGIGLHYILDITYELRRFKYIRFSYYRWFKENVVK